MQGLWLLAPAVLELIGSARAKGMPEHAIAWETAAAADEARRVEAREGLPRNMSIAGNVAEIRVEGTLTKKPDFFSMFFGGGNTTYTSIRQSLAVAATDPNVKSITLAIDSPGGMVEGLFETLDAIAALRAEGSKAIRVKAEQAQSAAYAIAAAAGPIDAASRGAMFGSIGTAVSYWVSPSVVTLTNSDSPDKRPDVTTDAGKAVIVKMLDQVNDEFARAIARGRGVELSTVKEEYGRGASLTAVHALKMGLIDRILGNGSTPLRAVNTGKKAMAENGTDAPRASAAEIDAAVARGVAQERDRVLYHVQMGEASGDMSIALEAIRSGAGNTLELAARYQSAHMNRSDRGKRQSEANAAEAVVAGTGQSASSADLGDAVVAQLKGSDRGFVRG